MYTHVRKGTYLAARAIPMFFLAAPCTHSGQDGGPSHVCSLFSKALCRCGQDAGSPVGGLAINSKCAVRTIRPSEPLLEAEIMLGQPIGTICYEMCPAPDVLAFLKSLSFSDISTAISEIYRIADEQ
eukprot:scaffold27705_cov43-Prasinocladus_malaysianus.AAC.1